MKKFYGIGTGPGDPEMLTLKAVRIMKEADVIFAPNNKGKNMALETAEDFIKDKKIVFLDYPMKAVTEDTYKDNAKIMEDAIEDGKVGAFLTIGDPMFYSTFVNTSMFFTENVEIEVVSGIPSFVAASGSSFVPLALKGEDFLVVDSIPETVRENVKTIAILKTYNVSKEDLEHLESMGFSYTYIQRASFPEEKILTKMEDIINEKNYMSLILARRN